MFKVPCSLPLSFSLELFVILVCYSCLFDDSNSFQLGWDGILLPFLGDWRRQAFFPIHILVFCASPEWFCPNHLLICWLGNPFTKAGLDKAVVSSAFCTVFLYYIINNDKLLGLKQDFLLAHSFAAQKSVCVLQILKTGSDKAKPKASWILPWGHGKTAVNFPLAVAASAPWLEDGGSSSFPALADCFPSRRPLTLIGTRPLLSPSHLWHSASSLVVSFQIRPLLLVKDNCQLVKGLSAETLVGLIRTLVTSAKSLLGVTSISVWISLVIQRWASWRAIFTTLWAIYSNTIEQIIKLFLDMISLCSAGDGELTM